MLIVHAPNIHQGGGRTLLSALLAAIDPPARVHLDVRLPSLPSLPPGVVVERFEASLAGRIVAERRLAGVALSDDHVLCFGNLPPLFPTRGRITVFLQNRYLVDPRGVAALPLRARLRLRAERAWLQRCLRGAEVIVQSTSMADAVFSALGCAARIIPFLPAASSAGEVFEESFDFAYVASGEAHKNHATLIEAWRLLAEGGETPSLALTIDAAPDADLARQIARAVEAGARIRCLGSLAPERVAALYKVSGALIYPSLIESFGLPLVEAREAGLPVLAAERDYVRDTIVPDQTFDPASPRSIARAVLRFLGRPERPAHGRTAGEFIAALRSGG